MASSGTGSHSPSSSQARLRRTKLSCVRMQAAPAVLFRSDCLAPHVRELIIPALYQCIASSTKKPEFRHPPFMFTCPPSSRGLLLTSEVLSNHETVMNNELESSYRQVVPSVGQLNSHNNSRLNQGWQMFAMTWYTSSRSTMGLCCSSAQSMQGPAFCPGRLGGWVAGHLQLMLQGGRLAQRGARVACDAAASVAFGIQCSTLLALGALIQSGSTAGLGQLVGQVWAPRLRRLQAGSQAGLVTGRVARVRLPA